MSGNACAEFAIHPAGPTHQAGSGLRGPTAGGGGAGAPVDGFAGGARRFGRCHLRQSTHFVIPLRPWPCLLAACVLVARCIHPGVADAGNFRASNGWKPAWKTTRSRQVTSRNFSSRPNRLMCAHWPGRECPRRWTPCTAGSTDETAPLPSSAEPVTDQWPAATLISAPIKPASPRHRHQHSQANPQFAPREHANRV